MFSQITQLIFKPRDLKRVETGQKMVFKYCLGLQYVWSFYYGITRLGLLSFCCQKKYSFASKHIFLCMCTS